ncbi:MAG: 1-acyl-sn-glycerol-3-phosphate acyltransferase [Ginsengibacter sp.]
MLYKLLLLPARLSIYFYCKKIIINKKEILNWKGPLLIAANHPNSFLDAIILSSIFKQPIYSLARGDAFAGKFYSKILQSLNMLPVYRVSEGVENLDHNYTTFNACQQLFKENKIVLIFSEGRCINEWHLRPLKKGTARLAVTAWTENVPLKIIPLGINYSSFRKFGKVVILNFGNTITRESIQEEFTSGKALNEFNSLLKNELQELVYEIKKGDTEKIKEIFGLNQNPLKKIVMFIPAVIGFLLHAPLYYAIVLFIKNRAKDHFDSILVGALFLFYPIYIVLLILIAFLISSSVYSALLFLLLPLTALSLLHFKQLAPKPDK